jgi:hypothetical protein
LDSKYFDDSDFGHCLRDLGRTTDAVRYAGRSLVGADRTFIRRDFFVTVVLADAHLAAGYLERECNVALNALNNGEPITSARCVNYLREFRHRLAEGRQLRQAAEFQEQAARSRLWRIASRNDPEASVRSARK